MTAPKPSCQIQPRDLAILRDLFESRVATIAQLAVLHFDGKEEGATKRLRALKAEGLIAERRRMHAPWVLSLAPDGLKLLESEGILSEYPPVAISRLEKRADVSESRLDHELRVMDVKVAFHRAGQTKTDISVAEFGTWPVLYQFTPRSTTSEKNTQVQPDGFIRIHATAAEGKFEHCFFLEVDMGTESNVAVLAPRAKAYRDYYRTGGFAEKNGQPASAFLEYPFRVLFVCKSEQRIRNICRALLDLMPPVLSHSWFTTFDEIEVDPFGPIWMRPMDVRSENPLPRHPGKVPTTGSTAPRPKLQLLGTD